MNTIHVLLVENTTSLKAPLEQSLDTIEHEKFKVEVATPKAAEESFHFARRTTDVVLFGEGVPSATVIRLAKAYRSQGNAGHLIMLTKESEPHVPALMKKAGIDDILNVMEIATPVFGWTFISSIQTVGIKKKAQEYELTQERLQLVNNALDHLANSMGAPLDNLRQVSDQLRKNGNGAKAAALYQQLAENVAAMDDYLKELLDIRHRLGKETKVINKVLQVKTRT